MATVDAASAKARLDALAKPPGSLGTLEHWAATLCTVQRTLTPSADPATILVFCGDHGVKKADGALSPYPPAVTQTIFRALASGMSATAVLTRTNGAFLTVVDVGIDGDVSSVRSKDLALATVTHDKVAEGTADCRSAPAMDVMTMCRAINVGRVRVAAEVDKRSAKVVGIGEVGIGNTTSAAALLALITRADAAECCGRGTGLDDAGLAHKVDVVRQIVDEHKACVASTSSDAEAARTALQLAGGLEIAAMVGAYLEAQEKGVVALVDGFISAVAALTAARLEPKCRAHMLFATALAEEPKAALGGDLLAKALNAEPALAMGLRLGEASGAALALPLLRSAAAVVRDMATLEEAMGLGN